MEGVYSIATENDVSLSQKTVGTNEGK